MRTNNAGFTDEQRERELLAAAERREQSCVSLQPGEVTDEQSKHGRRAERARDERRDPTTAATAARGGTASAEGASTQRPKHSALRRRQRWRRRHARAQRALKAAALSEPFD